jgi:hypothetical protein
MNNNLDKKLDEELISIFETISRNCPSSEIPILIFYFRQIYQLIIEDRIRKGSGNTPEFFRYLSDFGTNYSIGFNQKGE